MDRIFCSSYVVNIDIQKTQLHGSLKTFAITPCKITIVGGKGGVTDFCGYSMITTFLAIK